jgi:serine/threonine protein kinase
MNVASHPPYSRVVCPSCQVENRVKKQFGPYVLNRRHAIGGMSSVFIATDSTLDRDVALKILSEEFSRDEKRISAFEDEARLTASFSHPNVVSVFTTGKAFGRLYIAMEFVPGGHFEHHIRERGRIPEMEALPLAIQVAEGLKGAQAAGLIHRDVKPGNILLDAEGNAKLVDFGLALVTQAGKAKAEEIWATPYYVPPEAIEGGVEDFRADIYAFGATFYHALAGKPPCNEESMATDVLKEAKRRIVPLKKAAPDLCEETCAVIDRAMAFDPVNRFSSYDEMIGALHTSLKIVNGELVRDAEGITKSQRRLELRKKNQQNIFLAAAAAVLLCTAIAGIVLLKSSESPPPKPKPAVIAAEATPDDGEKSAYHIAQKYRAARTALERGELRAADTRFAALLADGAVQEPTRTWAGLEAVVAAMMDGRMNDARKHASAASEHIKGVHAVDESEFQTAVRPILEKLRDPAFVGQNDVVLGSKGSEVHMALFIAGLKNWEQGGFDQALPFLRAFSTEPSITQDNVLAWYQEAVKGYLEDYGRMKSDSLHSDPKTPESCREAIERLNETLTLLKTKGRARFNVRARQLDLAKLERDLSNAQRSEYNVQSAMQDGEKLLRNIEFSAKDYRFADIVKYLNGFKGDPPGCKHSSLMVVSRASLNLLTEIEADLLNEPVNLPLTLKDGTAIVSLAVKDAKIYSKDQNGEVREIRWMDLPPDQIINLNANLVERLTAEPDRTRRNESAIAFEWLSGQRKSAIAAAESLAKKSDSFRSRWEVISPGLPK